MMIKISPTVTAQQQAQMLEDIKRKIIWKNYLEIMYMYVYMKTKKFRKNS